MAEHSQWLSGATILPYTLERKGQKVIIMLMQCKGQRQGGGDWSGNWHAVTVTGPRSIEINNAAAPRERTGKRKNQFWILGPPKSLKMIIFPWSYQIKLKQLQDGRGRKAEDPASRWQVVRLDGQRDGATSWQAELGRCWSCCFVLLWFALRSPLCITQRQWNGPEALIKMHL